jgi:hypothetical protein
MVRRAMSTYDWLLFLHITGAFLLTGGVIVTGTFSIAAQFRERPSEIALLLGLGRFAVIAIGIVGLAMGGQGGSREKQTEELAAKLAAEGDRPSAELRARLRDPVTLVLSYGGLVTIIGVLVLMVWKPGA